MWSEPGIVDVTTTLFSDGRSRNVDGHARLPFSSVRCVFMPWDKHKHFGFHCKEGCWTEELFRIGNTFELYVKKKKKKKKKL